MSTVNATQDLPVPAEKVWAMIGEFHGLSNWHPAIERSELEEGGTVRRLHVVGGGTIVERLERKDDESFEYRYSIVDSPLPVADYTSTLRVRRDDSGKGCTVEWAGDFEPAGDASPAQAEKVIQDIYNAGMQNLQKIFGGSR